MFLAPLLCAGDAIRPLRLLLLALLASPSPAFAGFDPALALARKLVAGDPFPKSDILRGPGLPGTEGLLCCDAELTDRCGILLIDLWVLRARDGESLATGLCAPPDLLRRHALGAGLGDASMPPGEPIRSLSSSSNSACFQASRIEKDDMGFGRRDSAGVVDMLRSGGADERGADLVDRALSDLRSGVDVRRAGLADVTSNLWPGGGGVVPVHLWCLVADFVLFDLLR